MADPTDDDVEFVRTYTHGAGGWSDQQISDLIAKTTCTDGSFDLWASAALVLEMRLIGLVDSPGQGATRIRTGDAQVAYVSAGGSSSLLRSLINRYWRRACPEVRAVWSPSGWRTVDVAAGRVYELQSLFGGGVPLLPNQLVNGPEGDIVLGV